jgi:hypothetical protein
MATAMATAMATVTVTVTPVAKTVLEWARKAIRHPSPLQTRPRVQDDDPRVSDRLAYPCIPRFSSTATSILAAWSAIARDESRVTHEIRAIE